MVYLKRSSGCSWSGCMTASGSLGSGPDATGNGDICAAVLSQAVPAVFMMSVLTSCTASLQVQQLVIADQQS